MLIVPNLFFLFHITSARKTKKRVGLQDEVQTDTISRKEDKFEENVGFEVDYGNAKGKDMCV